MTHSTRQRSLPGVPRLSRIAAVVALAAALLPISAIAVQAAAACSSTTGPTGYTVGVCVSPGSGSVSGTVTASATVTISSTTVRPSYATFCLDGSLTSSPTCVNGGVGYLIRDFKAQSQPQQTVSIWSFSLPTSHWIDGAHGLTAVVSMRDGTQTVPTTATLTFSNGVATQPINNSTPVISTGTKPGAGKPLVVAAVGDGAAGESASHSVAKLIGGWSPNLFLYLGDVYQDGSYLEFTNWYDTTFGTFKAITDPVPGNHEYLSKSDLAASAKVGPAGVAYFDYWNNLPHYYSFDAGTWHFIALDANETPMGGPAWKAQLAWLTADLAAHPTSCTIVYWHQPAFNVGTEPIPTSSKTLWSMVAGKATLVLDGHDHTYQRWTAMDGAGNPSATGTVEIVDGTGGHAAGSFATTDTRVLARSTLAGALRLSLSATTASVQFYATSGSLVDSATIPCR